MGDQPELSPGNSGVQRNAESIMIAWLGFELSCNLQPRRIHIPNGGRLELDGFSEDPLIICEAWAHQGAPKSAQKFKVMNDGMKLIMARRVIGEDARAVLLFADEEAANHFRGHSWQATALAESRIEIMIATLADEVKAQIRNAQTRQYR